MGTEAYSLSLPQPHPNLPNAPRMATYAVKITGASQGAFKGDEIIFKGAEGMIQVLHWRKCVISPRDPHTGFVSGKREYQLMEFCSKLSPAAINLQTALATNEVLSKVEFKCWTQAAGGLNTGMTVIYTVELTNAVVAYYSDEASPIDGTTYMRYGLTFQKIDCTWVKGGLAFSDDWYGGTR